MNRYKLLLISVSFFMVHCLAQKTSLTLTQATQQSWAGGAAGSGSGINYKLSFTANKAGTYKFGYLYNGDVVLPIKYASASGKEDSLVILKADQLLDIHVERYFPGEVDTRVHRDTLIAHQFKNNALKAGALPKFEGKGLLIYYCNGKKQYMPIAAFKSLGAIAYP